LYSSSVFFFSSRRRHTRSKRDWSSDVCSSDLSPEVVSSDFVGSTHAGVVDGLATIASGKHLVLYVWYDNEYGYSNQVIRIVEDIAGARPQVLPERLAPSAL